MRATSVVIPHYGDPTPTLALLRQLASQEGGGALELIVVDDHSPDPFHCADPKVTVVRRATNGGFGSAVNSGAQVASGERLLILNSDVTIGVHFVAELGAVADAWGPAVVGPLIMASDGRVDFSARAFPRTRHQLVEWLTPLARWRETDSWHRAVGHDLRAVPGEVVAVDWLVGAALLMPLPAFRAVGGFDEGYFMNSEEIDLQRRLAERGVPRIFAGTVELVHAGGASSDPERRRQWLVDSRFHYASKWGGRRHLAIGLGAASAANAAVNTLRQALGRDVPALAVLRTERDLVTGALRRARGGAPTTPTKGNS